MKQLVWLIGLLLFIGSQSVYAQQDGCEAAFADVNQFAAAVYAETTADIQEGLIQWDSTDWEQIVRRMVGSAEFFLNNCTDLDQPLASQPEVVEQLAALSLLAAPLAEVEVGVDFGIVELRSDFVPVAELIDLNLDGINELLLHTQVPYFSQDTVYTIRGGLSIAFFLTDFGWQGQVLAPITGFVTDETGDHVSYAMTENNNLSVEYSDQALVIFPAPEVQVLDVNGTALTFVTMYSATPAGEAKELAVLTWQKEVPSVELRIAFDDWCYPGQALNWEIREDGSVFVPSNGGDASSPLHCGNTPETLFQWVDDHYMAQ